MIIHPKTISEKSHRKLVIIVNLGMGTDRLRSLEMGSIVCAFLALSFLYFLMLYCAYLYGMFYLSSYFFTHIYIKINTQCICQSSPGKQNQISIYIYRERYIHLYFYRFLSLCIYSCLARKSGRVSMLQS